MDDAILPSTVVPIWQARGRCHWIATVTVFDTPPNPSEIDKGTASPVGAVCGTCTFTWFSPIYPGARPEKVTVAVTVPIVTVGVITVFASGFADAAAPSADGLSTGPSPVQ